MTDSDKAYEPKNYQRIRRAVKELYGYWPF
jgi:hypothetical protein